MPIVQGQQVPNDPYQYLHIEDFTAGLYNYSEVSTGKVPLPAPPISANPEYTWGCFGLQSGGLSPMPRLTARIAYKTTTIPKTTITGTHVLVSFLAINPTTPSNDTQLLFGFQAYKTSSPYKQFYKAYWAMTNVPTTWTALLTHTKTPTAATTSVWGSPFAFFTRLNKLTSTTGPAPVLVFPSLATLEPTVGTKGHIWVYPNPYTRTDTYAYTILRGTGTTTHKPNTTGSYVGQVFGFNGRICVLSNRVDTFGSGSKKISTNEAIKFTTYKTKPTQANVFTTATNAPTGTYLAPENPFGYGCVGSISNGELFLVKKWGGAVYLQGTLKTPSVTILPGVKPTGNLYGRGQATSTGFFYCVQTDGAYVWNGGNVSEKISTQINDTFYVVQTRIGTSTQITIAKEHHTNYGFFVQRFNNFILFSNNYVYDTVTKAWWVLYPNLTQKITTATLSIAPKSFFHYAQGSSLQAIWAAPATIPKTAATTPGKTQYFLWKFTMTRPAQSWQWTSNPITMTPNNGNVVDIRQLVVRVGASYSNFGGTLKIKIGSLKQIKTNKAWTTTLTVPASNVITTFRLNVGKTSTGYSALGLPTTVIQIIATSSLYAPIVHSLDIGYQVRASVGTTKGLS